MIAELSPQRITELLQVAIDAATEGGQVLMRYFREGVEVRNKSAAGGASFDLVSDADLESEQAIAKRLRQAFPDHQLMGEEALGKTIDPTACDDLWVIDPLDGTNNYAHRIPHFAVSIAYYHCGQPVVGVVYNPVTDDWYTAAATIGACHNGKNVHVCDSTTLQQCIVGCGFYYDRGEMMRRTLRVIEELFSHQIHGIRRFGTASLDLCMVGCGQFGGFFEYQLAPWDYAAGRLFVELAGGKVTTSKGDPLALTTTGIVASNTAVHDLILEITQRHHP